MKKSVLFPRWCFPLFLILPFMAMAAQAAELDPAYLKAFGSGAILASFKGLPQKTAYDPAQFEVRDGIFFVKGGDASATLDFRAILPEGKTYRSVLETLKKEKATEYATRVEDQSVWMIWFSHDMTGTAQDKNWPAKADSLPSGAPSIVFHTPLSDAQLDWNSVGLTWEQLTASFKIGEWLTQAKPGYRIFIAHTVGFLHASPAPATPIASEGAAASASCSSGCGDSSCGQPTAAPLAVAAPLAKAILTIAEKK